jgi:chromosome segregation ATPase
MPIEFKEEHLREITENSERSKSNCHRIDEIEEDIKSLQEDNRALYEMSASIKTLTDGVVSIKADVKDIKNDYGEMKSEIQDIKNTPIKTKAGFVDNVGKLIFTAVVTGVVAFVLGQVCPVIFK